MVKSRIGASRVDLLGRVISADGVPPKMTEFLSNITHLIRPITALVKNGASYFFTSVMEDTVHDLLAALS